MKLKKFKFGDLVRIKYSNFFKYKSLKGLIGIYIKTNYHNQKDAETIILVKNKFYYSFWDSEFEKL